MHAAGDHSDGARLRALIVILWRAGLRIGEALDLAKTDLDPSRGAVLVRHGKGGRRREVGMDRSAWHQLQQWLKFRDDLPVGTLLLIQRQLGHANLGITPIYLQRIDSSEIIDTVHSRPAPVIPATAGLHTRR